MYQLLEREHSFSDFADASDLAHQLDTDPRALSHQNRTGSAEYARSTLRKLVDGSPLVEVAERIILQPDRSDDEVRSDADALAREVRSAARKRVKYPELSLRFKWLYCIHKSGGRVAHRAPYTLERMRRDFDLSEEMTSAWLTWARVEELLVAAGDLLALTVHGNHFVANIMCRFHKAGAYEAWEPPLAPEWGIYPAEDLDDEIPVLRAERLPGDIKLMLKTEWWAPFSVLIVHNRDVFAGKNNSGADIYETRAQLGVWLRKLVGARGLVYHVDDGAGLLAVLLTNCAIEDATTFAGRVLETMIDVEEMTDLQVFATEYPDVGYEDGEFKKVVEGMMDGALSAHGPYRLYVVEGGETKPITKGSAALLRKDAGPQEIDRSLN